MIEGVIVRWAGEIEDCSVRLVLEVRGCGGGGVGARGGFGEAV